MERIVKRGIVGGILGGLFGLFITVPWEPLLGVDGPVLQMALPMTVAFALFGAWFGPFHAWQTRKKLAASTHRGLKQPTIDWRLETALG